MSPPPRYSDRCRVLVEVAPRGPKPDRGRSPLLPSTAALGLARHEGRHKCRDFSVARESSRALPVLPLVALTILFLVAAPPTFARTWKSSDGVYSVDAEYVGAKDGKVSLRKANGDVIEVPLVRLSAEDQAYVAKQAVASDDSSTPVATSPAPQVQRFSQLVELSGRLRTASEVVRAYKLFLQDERIAEPDRKSAEEQLPGWEEREETHGSCGVALA